MSRWHRIDRLSAAGRSLAWVAVAAIPIVAVSWLFQPTSISAAASGGGWVALAGFCYAVLTALTLTERAGRLRRRQATVASEWSVHFLAQLTVVLASGIVFVRGGSSRLAMLGLDTLIAATATVALLATVWELIGRFVTPIDAGDWGIFRMFRWNTASPARGVVLAGVTLIAALVLSAAVAYCELSRAG